jgi:hypothetical protein
MSEHAKKLDEYFTKWYDIREVSANLDIDRIFVNDSRKITVMYKIDMKPDRAGYVALQTLEDEKTGSHGWVWSGAVDIIVYYVVPENVLYMINPYDLRDHIIFWQGAFGLDRMRKGHGVYVPYKHFAKACKVREL